MPFGKMHTPFLAKRGTDRFNNPDKEVTARAIIAIEEQEGKDSALMLSMITLAFVLFFTSSKKMHFLELDSHNTISFLPIIAKTIPGKPAPDPISYIGLSFCWSGNNENS